MPREHNFLIGDGERLAQPVRINRSSGPKNPPYDLATAKARLSLDLLSTRESVAALPADACPRDEAVAVLTLHPRYVSKSDFPRTLLSAVGLRAVGGRSRRVKPDEWGVEEHPETALTEDIFVAGARSAFARWSDHIEQWSAITTGADELSHIEEMAPFAAGTKVRGLPESKRALLEIVLHNSRSDHVVLDFIGYARAHGGDPLIARRRDVDGLTFIPVHIDRDRVEELAQFSFVRVARGMPSLRPPRPSITRGASGFPVSLPTAPAADSTTRAVIFDGGLPNAAQSALSQWVTLIEPPRIGPPVADFQEHGLGVTTAFLFGPLMAGSPVPTPFCAVDHVRVLDGGTGAGGDIEYLDVLDRINDHLERNPDLYPLINLSLGPNLAVDDYDITLWTALLDKRFAHGRSLTTVAAGNDGQLDAAAGLNRVQPPADGVNVLTVGAADRSTPNWDRAEYSCVGPGRCPGLVKPDGVAFGGSSTELFGILGATLRGQATSGTSYAAPYALRSAAAIRAQLGTKLEPLTIRALLIHRAETDGHQWQDVGWGRFEADAGRLITCDDDEALVVYQGTLPVGEHLRVPVAMPQRPLNGMVTVTATLVIAPEVDPEYPGTYTRSGLEVAFRPHSGKHGTTSGKKSAHPKTRTFFASSQLPGTAEGLLREDGHKWEPCLRNEQRMRATSLSSPYFDIYYHSRQGGIAATSPQPIPYAFIVSLKAPRVVDLYDQVVRNYASILQPIRPRTRLQIVP